MLVEAAAKDWGVPASEITPRTQVPPRDLKDWMRVGKRLPRVDCRAKADRSAQFTMDVKVSRNTYGIAGDNAFMRTCLPERTG